MRTHRIYTSFDLEVGAEADLGDKTAHYLSRVLRLATGSRLVLFNGDGSDYHGELTALGRQSVQVKILERLPNHSESPLRITLAQSLSRGERMEYSLQKATELGVAAVQLLDTERVELKLKGARLKKKMVHWQAVMESACEQCGRATVPELRAPVSLREWLESPAMRLVLDAGARDGLADVELGDPIEIAVGPEGGFSDVEVAQMTKSGALAVRLGPRVLRTETAGPAAIAALQVIAGDFA